MIELSSQNQDFTPFFIVGCGRSGTTLLAVLLNRHHLIAIPGETAFFNGVLPRLRVEEICRRGNSDRHEALVDVLLSGRCLWWVDELGLEREKLLARFRRYPADAPHLWRAMLEDYAERAGKPRVGEKTPSHLNHVAQILHWYPHAKIICIVRDGRDVALSLQRLHWASNDLRANCQQWSQWSRLSRRWEKVYASRFLRIHFEDLVRQPRPTLQRVANFLGVEVEDAQFVPSETAGPFPPREEAWKAKSKQEMDPRRIEAWRTAATPEEICLMNSMMGVELRRMGYRHTGLGGCAPRQRVREGAYKGLYRVLFHVRLWHCANNLRTAVFEERATRAGYYQWLRWGRRAVHSGWKRWMRAEK